jgi:hypothetical protein
MFKASGVEHSNDVEGDRNYVMVEHESSQRAFTPLTDEDVLAQYRIASLAPLSRNIWDEVSSPSDEPSVSVVNHNAVQEEASRKAQKMESENEALRRKIQELEQKLSIEIERRIEAEGHRIAAEAARERKIQELEQKLSTETDRYVDAERHRIAAEAARETLETQLAAERVAVGVAQQQVQAAQAAAQAAQAVAQAAQAQAAAPAPAIKDINDAEKASRQSRELRWMNNSNENPAQLAKELGISQKEFETNVIQRIRGR